MPIHTLIKLPFIQLRDNSIESSSIKRIILPKSKVAYPSSMRLAILRNQLALTIHVNRVDLVPANKRLTFRIDSTGPNGILMFAVSLPLQNVCILQSLPKSGLRIRSNTVDSLLETSNQQWFCLVLMSRQRQKMPSPMVTVLRRDNEARFGLYSQMRTSLVLEAATSRQFAGLVMEAVQVMCSNGGDASGWMVVIWWD